MLWDLLHSNLNPFLGGLSRIIERGSRGIAFVLNSMVFNVVPLIFEIILVCGLTVKTHLQIVFFPPENKIFKFHCELVLTIWN